MKLDDRTVSLVTNLCYAAVVAFLGMMPVEAASVLLHERTIALSFPASDVAWDVQRNRVYLTDGAAKKLLAVNLADGTIAASYEFKHTPESIALRPDGRRVYVGLVTRSHADGWFGEHEGYIGEVNLETEAKSNEFQIRLDPFDLIATDTGWVVVSDGSGQWTKVASYRAATGTEINTASIRQRSRLSLHPGQRDFYSADTDLGPSDIRHWTIDPGSGQISDRGDSPYHGEYAMSGNVFIHPSGTNLVTRGGTVLTSAPFPTQDMRFIRALENATVEGVAFDMMRKAIFTVGSAGAQNRVPKIIHYGPTYEVVREYFLTNSPTYIEVISNFIHVAEVRPNQTILAAYRNPAVGGDENQPPRADFSWSPQDPTTLDDIAFDASRTVDDTDPIEQLLYRWDWNGDGVWDTSFTNALVAVHRYNLAGTNTVRLEAKDHFGAVGTVEKRVTVSLAADTGLPGGTNTPYQLPFVPEGVVQDSPRLQLYATDPAGKRLVRLNLTNGIIEREFRFNYPPEAITITPNGKRMYVTLPTAPHSFWTGGKPHEGFIAAFDLEAGVKVRELPVKIDPFDIVATDNGWLVVTDGSDQWTELASFDATTGVKVGSVSIYHRARLALHPSQTSVYATDTSLSPSDIHHIRLDPGTGALTGRWDSPYHGDYPLGGDVFVHPDGKSVFSRDGVQLSSSTLQQFDLRFLIRLPITPNAEMAFDMSRNLMAVASGAAITFLNSSNFNVITAYPVAHSARWVSLQDGWVTALSVSQTNALVQRRRVPALTLEENLPPSVTLVHPTNQMVIGVPAAVTLQAAAKDEDGHITRVEFYSDQTLLGSVTNAPYHFVWQAATNGLRALAAVSYDNFGRTATSTLAQVTLNLAPRVAWLFPTNNSVLTQPSSLILEASAADTDGRIVRVDFLRDDVVIGSRSEPPYAMTLTNFLGGPLKFAALAVDDLGSATLSVPVSILVTGVATDNFILGTPMRGNEITLTGSNRIATKQPGEPNHAGQGGGKSIWWSWTAQSSGTAILTTAGSSFDTLLAVYIGNNVAALSQVASNNDDPANPPASRVKFRTVPGVTYHIVVDGNNAATGDVRLQLAFVPGTTSVSNDLFANAVSVVGLPAVMTGGNFGATKEPLEPNHAESSGGRSVWWRWTSPVPGRVEVNTDGSDFDTVLAVYTGPPDSLALLRPVAANDDGADASITSRVKFGADIGTTYHIAVDGFAGATGNIRLEIKADFSAPPIPATAGALSIRRADGDLLLILSDAPTGQIVLLRSTELANWVPIMTNRIDTGSAVMRLPSAGQGPVSFYRVLLRE